ncbi:hypothetical protein F2Q68_00039957 [Brassica cretica]|uniref:Uncharacterized protein n=1 Tax=Brassica cretica TaxID=69181 RepID=A0A8S9MGA0_BRACR|nr:hypothetical protein F2Q68_00039957 [Brassica cretica]
MTIHDNSQLRDSHNQFSTNPTRDVRSDHRSVRPRPRTLSLNRPRPRFSVPCLNQTNNITIHSRTGNLDEVKRMDESAKRSDHKSIRFIRRPRPSLAVYTTNLGRLFPWRHVPLFLLLLISLSGIHLHGLAFPRSEHAGKTTPPHTGLSIYRESHTQLPRRNRHKQLKGKGTNCPFAAFRYNRPTALPLLWAVRKSGPVHHPESLVQLPRPTDPWEFMPRSHQPITAHDPTTPARTITLHRAELSWPPNVPS